jgi:hypothetical protein
MSFFALTGNVRSQIGYGFSGSAADLTWPLTADTNVQGDDLYTSWGAANDFQIEWQNSVTRAKLLSAGDILYQAGTNKKHSFSDGVLTLLDVDPGDQEVWISPDGSAVDTFYSFTDAPFATSGAAIDWFIALDFANGDDEITFFRIDMDNAASHSGTGNIINVGEIEDLAGEANANLHGILIGTLTGTAGAAGEQEIAIAIEGGWDTVLEAYDLGTTGDANTESIYIEHSADLTGAGGEGYIIAVDSQGTGASGMDLQLRPAADSNAMLILGQPGEVQTNSIMLFTSGTSKTVAHTRIINTNGNSVVDFVSNAGTGANMDWAQKFVLSGIDNSADSVYITWAENTNPGTMPTEYWFNFDSTNSAEEILAGTPVVMDTFTQSALPASTNGAVVYCSDCNPDATCTGSGAGAMAFRIAGAWACELN